MSIEVNPVLPVPKFIPGRIVEYRTPDGDRMPVRIVAACIEVDASDPDHFQILYLCEWRTLEHHIHRYHLAEHSLAPVGGE